MATIYVGVDISKSTFDVAIMIMGKTARAKFSNDRNGSQEFIAWLNSKKVDLGALHVCMEATGRYYKKLAKYLHALNIRVSVENPKQISQFSGAKNSRTKTDSQDASIIAEYCKALNPRPWVPKKPSLEALRDWITVQENLKRQHVSCVLLQKEMEGEHAKELAREIKSLEKTLRRIAERIKQLMKDHKDLESQAALLDTIPSIGSETIAVLLAIVDPTTFESTNQAVAFVGLCPQIKESGTSVRGKAYMTKSGHPLVKKAVYVLTGRYKIQPFS